MAKDGTPGVRGPGGPPQPTPRGRQTGPRTVSPARARFEQQSAPVLRVLHGAPRWVIIILPAVLLFGGLVSTGPWAPLGALLLVLVAAYLAWLLALSWPAITPGPRFIRALTVAAILGLAGLKLLGRF